MSDRITTTIYNELLSIYGHCNLSKYATCINILMENDIEKKYACLKEFINHPKLCMLLLSKVDRCGRCKLIYCTNRLMRQVCAKCHNNYNVALLKNDLTWIL